MTLYFEKDGVKLYLGDCVEVMSSFAEPVADHVITDPPYEAEAHSAGRLTSAVLASAGDSGEDREVVDAQLDFCAMSKELRAESTRQMVRLSSGWQLIFCQIEGVTEWRNALVGAGSRYRRAMAWVKPDSTPKFSGDGPAQGFESMCLGWNRPGRSVWNAGGKRGVYIHNKYNADVTGHQTQKPISLMLELLEDFTMPGETILDPFVGSGTTGVACIRLGRKFIGIEKEERYAEMAAKRLEAESLGLDFKAASAGQLSLLGGT